MNNRKAILALVVCLALASPAIAAGLEEVMLRDGTTGMVEVLETTQDTVSVKFSTKSGATGQTKLKAASMDPVNFYEIRRKHMEPTAENHVRLALFCAGQGLFNRAKRQMDLARAIDPETDAKLGARPDILEKIAAYLFEAVERHEREGNPELARDIAERMVTKLPETKAADEARAWLKKSEDEAEARRVTEEKAREEKLEKTEAADQKAALKARETVLKPIREMIDKGHKLSVAGLQEKSTSKSKSAFQAAASECKKALERVKKEKGKKGVAPGTLEELDKLEALAKNECVDALLHAANVDLGSGNVNGAKKYAELALQVDPGNARAQDMINKAQMVNSDKFYLDEIRSRRPRGGGGPGRR